MTDRIEELLIRGAGEGVYPGAVLLVSRGDKIVRLLEVGSRSLTPERQPMTRETIFDLASLTKPLATVLALMKLVDESRIGLDQTLSTIITDAELGDKKGLTPRLLLCHCAGLRDWKPFYLELVKYPIEERKDRLRRWLMEEPFAYAPGSGCLYSDLGFMILEWVIEKAAGTSLADYLEALFFRPLSLEKTFFSGRPVYRSFDKGLFAATEDCPWRKKIMCGEVDDENAYAMGGYSGHAGLFGVADEVHRLANLFRMHYLGTREDYFRQETVRAFLKRQDLVKGCTWALGWDTPSSAGSSAGMYFSRNSVGHLGFTGTSLWMDLEKDIHIIFLTNRVHPTRKNEKLRAFRPILHDTVMEELGFI